MSDAGGKDTDIICNVEAEAALLGALLMENDLIDRAADVVDVEDFSFALHGRIFSALLYEFAQGKKVTPVTLRPYFDGDDDIKDLGGVGYLARLTADAAGLLAFKELCAQIADLGIRRRMQEGFKAAMAACSDMSAKIGDIIGQADAAMTISGKEEIHQVSGAECFDEVLTGFDDVGAGGVLCGSIERLDDVLGSIRPKQLIIGAGRPGMGKTAVAISYAIGAARRGHGVLFISLEMSSHELGMRMASDLCFDMGEHDRVPFAAIQAGTINDRQRDAIRRARDFMADLPLFVVDAGSMTIGRLNMMVRRYARRMEAKGQKLELVIVDYLQLLHPDQRNRSAYENVSEVSRGLKACAKENAVGVLALAQLSREVEKREDKRPMLSDLRDSGQIEQDADGVLFLLRQEYYLLKNEPDPGSDKHEAWRVLLERNRGKIEFIVAKRRNGVEGYSAGRFFGPYQAVR